ncbi:hypothetical protein GLW00_12010 [Halobacillus litoralis]|uniref:Uncharacterized protein n=1 Tax=Halobacillus litoralis TaxID=45668 RepID=A0A845FCT3_9BACI|nr:hypothetical protein [Halobacillus litoralis]MYL71584.1 hypothetical protein [Halobacillus litoralis]
MAFIIIAGFVIPWITGVYLYKKAPIIFYTTAPITALIAVVLNQAGIHMGLWRVNHMPSIVLLDSLFLDLGIFTIAGAWFTYMLVYKSINPLWIYIIFIGGMASLEILALLVETIEYNQSWNFFYTLLMYIGGFLIIGWIVNILEKLKVFP